MEKNSLITAIDFFNSISVVVEDISTTFNYQNGNKVVKATYSYKGSKYTTKPLYYKEISTLSDVRNIKGLHKIFGKSVYWLDIQKHKWPRGSKESDLDSIVIDNMLPNSNDLHFRNFLLLLANNQKTGFIQQITDDGRSAQYHHNLENNNHWHDLVLWIKETIKTNGNPINKNYFQHLIYKWYDGKRTSLNRPNPYKIVEDLNKNIKSVSPIMELKKTQELLKYKKQIILQGPPGTGKTKKAKEIAATMLGLSETEDLKNNEQFKLIQFHPSYTYEDFVRGIVAKPNEEEGGGILYEAENKTLGKFAKAALENYRLSREENTDAGTDKWIEEKFEEFKSEIEARLAEKEIDLSGDVTIFKVTQNSFLYGKNWKISSHIRFGDFKKLIKEILEDKLELSNKQIPKEHSVHAHYRYTYYNALLSQFFDKYEFNISFEKQIEKKYVLVIDEINRANLPAVLGELIYALEYRGEAVESMYEINEDSRFILPPNLLLIGTMNTADRSVGHIDYAIRRRFAFVPALPKDLTSELGKNFKRDLFLKVSKLFVENAEEYWANNEVRLVRAETLSSEFEPEDVWLGHSYFIDKPDEGGPMDVRLKYEIKPILLEYLKDGVLKETAKDKIESLSIGHD